MADTSPVVLKPCPFCGKAHTLKITTAQELAEQDSDYDGEFWEHSESFAVICDASRPEGPGGCGASGGFFPTEAEAVAAWNTRPTPPTADERAALAAECKRLRVSYGKAAVKVSLSVTAENIDALTAVETELDAAIDRLAGKP